VRARIARQIEEFFGREVGGRDALEDLLVGGIGRLGGAPVLADQRLDRRPVDDVERIERAAAPSTTSVARRCCRDLSLTPPQMCRPRRSSANATAARGPNRAVE
jgi:hypothetical protein